MTHQNSLTIEKIREIINSPFFSSEMIQTIFPHQSLDAQKSKLKRWVEQNKIIRLRNGLYIFGSSENNILNSSFQLANHLYLPSYVSLESALSHWNLIPEGVMTTTSVTLKRGKNISTPIGSFQFEFLRPKYYREGFFYSENNSDHFLIATPLKALLDFIYLRNKNYSKFQHLEEDLRFDWEEFLTYKEFISKESLNFYFNLYQEKRMKKIIKIIRRKLIE
jgi:hypothetical protein